MGCDVVTACAPPVDTEQVPAPCIQIPSFPQGATPIHGGRGLPGWGITWSVHQHQVASTVRPKMRPGQGMSPLTGSRSMWKASGRGRWQVVLGTVALGMACLYRCSRPGYQPTSWKPVGGDLSE